MSLRYLAAAVIMELPQRCGQSFSAVIGSFHDGGKRGAGPVCDSGKRDDV